MKVVLNKEYGGFSLSKAAYEELGVEWDDFGFDFNDKRTDPKLIACVEKLGDKADGAYSKLKIVEIPDDCYWEMNEYDGYETIIYSQSPIHVV